MFAADRIAVFDNDGTLWGEQPGYFRLRFALDRVKALAPWAGATSEWLQEGYLVDQRAKYFQVAYSSAPAMVMVSGRNFLVALLLYGTGVEFFDQSWKPDDVVKVK